MSPCLQVGIGRGLRLLRMVMSVPPHFHTNHLWSVWWHPCQWHHERQHRERERWCERGHREHSSQTGSGARGSGARGSIARASGARYCGARARWYNVYLHAGEEIGAQAAWWHVNHVNRCAAWCHLARGKGLDSIHLVACQSR